MMKVSFTLVWWVLIFLTLLTWGIGELDLEGGMIVSLLLLTTLLKGQMVIDHFMGLRNVHWWWQMVMLSWSLVIVASIGLAYWLGNRAV